MVSPFLHRDFNDMAKDILAVADECGFDLRSPESVTQFYDECLTLASDSFSSGDLSEGAGYLDIAQALARHAAADPVYAAHFQREMNGMFVNNLSCDHWQENGWMLLHCAEFPILRARIEDRYMLGHHEQLIAARQFKLAEALVASEPALQRPASGAPTGPQAFH